MKALSSLKSIGYYTLNWTALSLAVGILAGSASAFFLISLTWLTHLRENNVWIIAFLPLGGLIIGLSYYYWGNEAERGNNLILEEHRTPQKRIPFLMFPLVLGGTLITHLFGGSAGREGTAVQMGATLSDQISTWLKITTEQRRTLLLMGISAGFASVFGTPWAGAVFALEIVFLGSLQLRNVYPVFASAFVADFACHLWGAEHTVYAFYTRVPDLSFKLLLYALVAGVVFGTAARLFALNTHFWSSLFKRFISYPPLRPVIGGVVLAFIFLLWGDYRFAGLGIPQIEAAFTQEAAPFDFALKLLFTGFTLGAGFKGGEVTPLFFVGATLGSTLCLFVPLPMALLAAMGFVAVFAGATHTPLACTIMAIELFGFDGLVFFAIACFSAYLASGNKGIYSAQYLGFKKPF